MSHHWQLGRTYQVPDVAKSHLQVLISPFPFKKKMATLSFSDEPSRAFVTTLPV